MLHQQFVQDCFNEAQLVNPFETSEFDLNSNLGRVNDYENRKSVVQDHLFLHKVAIEAPKPRVVKDTGSGKTSTVQCPHC